MENEVARKIRHRCIRNIPAAGETDRAESGMNALAILVSPRSLRSNQSKRFVASFQHVNSSGRAFAMELQLEAIDQQRRQHLSQPLVFNRVPGMSQVRNARPEILRWYGFDI